MSSKTSQGGGGGGARDFLTPGRITALVLAVLGLIFVFQNTRQTKIRLLIPEVTMPLYLALLGMGVIGAICGAYLFRRRK
ncbi:DUF1049 domain-containing protein [Streptomyces sp. NPDC097619]|uniref:DUF1049 domain-containing protein n=1 Tax=Streptomyces sp. NPDC097619 TaxID=3157228 RepID=UPI0033213FFB